MAVEAVAEQPERQDNGDKNKGFVTFEPSRDTQGFGNSVCVALCLLCQAIRCCNLRRFFHKVESSVYPSFELAKNIKVIYNTKVI